MLLGGRDGRGNGSRGVRVFSAQRGMTRRGALFWLGGVAGSAMLAGCSLFGFVSARLRYRITLTFSTPEGHAIATAVQEIVRDDPPDSFRPMNNGLTKRTGDALVLKVGQKHYFVGLTMCGRLLDDLINSGNVAPPGAKVSGNGAEQIRAFAKAHGRAEMSGNRYLDLGGRGGDFQRRFGFTAFLDEGDFSTLQSVDLESVSGLDLLKIEIAWTDDAITRQAHVALPWLATLTEEQVRSHKSYDGYNIASLKSLSDQFGKPR